jgi:hypothetical protein
VGIDFIKKKNMKTKVRFEFGMLNGGVGIGECFTGELDISWMQVLMVVIMTTPDMKSVEEILNDFWGPHGYSIAIVPVCPSINPNIETYLFVVDKLDIANVENFSKS